MSGTGIVIGNFVGGATGGGAGSSTPPITPGFNPLSFRIDTNFIVGSNDYTLGVDASGTYDFTVNWGDGQSDVITSPTQPEITHAYSGAGARTITITPNTAYSVDHWSFGRRSSSIPSEALTDIFSFGDIKFYANEDIFNGCENFNTVANRAGVPNFQNRDIIDGFFFRNDSLGTTTEPDFSGWGAFTGTGLQFLRGNNLPPFSSSRVNVNFTFTPTSLQEAFLAQALFNSSLSNWTVSSCNNFSKTFSLASSFNQLLPWVFSTDAAVSINASEMFKDALAFNQDISSWNTSRFTDTSSMFESTSVSVFNQDISSWNTDSITNASSMFSGATSFTSDLSNWFSTGSLVNATLLTGGIIDIFKNAVAFDGAVDGWDTSNLTSLNGSFQGTSSFNQSLGSWDVGNVQFFIDTFNGSKLFVGLGLPGWDTSSAGFFTGMFNGASEFNQDLSAWNISSLTGAADMLTGTNISQENYERLLIGWESQTPSIQNGVTLSDVPASYGNGKAKAARANLITNYSWTISDNGAGNLPPPAFEFQVDTSLTETGSTANNQYRLPLMSTGTYNFYVSWGDGTVGDQITSWNQSEATHTYATSGTYFIQILAIADPFIGGNPIVDHISWASQDGTTLSASNDRLKVTSISKWGSAVIYLNEYVFTECPNLNITTAALPDFGSKALRTEAFSGCTALSGNISGWGTSSSPITGDASLFYKNGGQNPNVNFVAQPTGSLFTAFLSATNFNSSLSNWNTSSITSISRAFEGATSFNQNISTWNTASVTDMSGAFNGATAFDQNLANWVVRNVANASNMFTSSGISAANWDALLIGWAAQGLGAGSLQTNVTLSDINQYHGTVDSAAIAAYNKLTAAPYNWSIVDLGELPTSAFEFDIDTAQTVTGSTNADQYRLPLMSTGTYNFTVNWGDGQSNSIATWNQADATHTYATAGLYSISITGTIDHVSWASQNGTSLSQANDRKKIKDITDWGPAVIYLNEMVFFDCANMDITTTAAPTFGSKVMRDDYFYNCESFTGDISAWGTVASPITGSVEQILAQSFNGNPNLNFVFQRTSSEIYRAFFSCISYNNPLDNWDVSGSTDFTQAFFACSTFNQDISGWDVSAGARFVNMFGSAASFNQDISSWDMSSATQLNFMFDRAAVFNQDISTWDTSSVTTMQSTFEDATAFNQDLSSWDVGSLTTASNMLTNSGISAENWDKLLIGWAAQGTGAGSLQANVTLSDINQLHGSVDSAATAAYNKLVAAPYSWTIVDLGAAVVGNLLLDTSYGSGAEAAYSVRKLRTAYTGPAIKVQDTVGGSTQDIYFDANNNLDEAAIVSYGGSNDVFVETWYDQSINGNDATQASSAARPKIYDGTSGALVKQDGRVGIDFDGSGDVLVNTTVSITDYDFSIVNVNVHPATNGVPSGLYLDTSSNTYYQHSAIGGSGTFNNRLQARVGGTTGQAYTDAIEGQRNLNYLNFISATSRDITVNGVESGSNNTNVAFTAPNSLSIGAMNDTSPGGYFDGIAQEVILFGATKSGADQTSVEENIGDYFTQNTPLLDTYSGAAAAYSLRLLDSTYTGFAIKVQDNVGGATQDIGFDVFRELDTVSLAAYAGSNDVFVETWYDQSGNGVNAEQPSSTLRPKIYDGTTGVVTAGSAGNEKPAVEFDGVNDVIYQNSNLYIAGSQRNSFAVAKLNSTASDWGIFNTDWSPRVAQNMRSGTGTDFSSIIFSPNTTPITTLTGSTTLSTNQYLFESEYVNTDFSVYLNGSEDGTTTHASAKTGACDLSIGANFRNSSGRFNGKIQEIICYEESKSDQRSDIASAINFFYDIYTEPVAPLLLNNYPGAAAAYSLRRINSSYQGSAVLVQTTNNTKGPVYIGFDSNNDLDTVSLAAYGGSEEVVVAGWLDQSGNGNDAIQNSAASRPVIYRDSTATTPGVVTENGKPAVEYNGGTQELTLSSSISNATNIASVAKADTLNWNMLIGRSTDGGLRTKIDGKWYPAASSQLTEFQYEGEIAINGTELTTNTAAQSQQLIFSTAVSGGYPYALSQLGGTYPNRHWNGPIQELILWATDQSSNRTDIEENIGGYYDIPLAGLLDENPGAAAAYSLRRLSSTYTGSAIQVQRADNVGGTTDIGFDGYGNLDTAALTTAAAGNSMVVVTWFDQSGNSNDATQGTSANRPKIYDGTTGVVTEGSAGNEKPAVEFDGSNDILGGSSITSTDDLSMMLVNTWTGGPQLNFLFGQGRGFPGGTETNTDFYMGILNGNPDSVFFGVKTTNATPNWASTSYTSSNIQNAQTLHTGYYKRNANMYFYRNGSIQDSRTTYDGAIQNNHTLQMGSSFEPQGLFQEAILYPSDQSDNRTNIETNIGGYYDIPLPGLLDENPGAAAAYSLRRLSSTYTGSAIQVQRADNVGGTTDIGFDSYGDLDTTALTTAAQGNSMVVVTWFDQSGNSNDVTQSSSLLRPKIYDGTTAAVVVENGKPAVEFDGTNDGLISGQSLGITTTDAAIFVTYTVDASATGTIFSLQQASSAGVRGQQSTATNYRFEIKDPSGNVTLQTSDTAGQQVKSHFLAPNSQEIFSNGSNVKSSTTTYPDYHFYTPKIGFRNNDSYFLGKVQEFVFYDSNESDNRPSIEDNVGDYYGIEIAGLLDQYSGAAAGYSLRKLSNSYTGFAIKVQDNVGGATQDIGFNADGELDTVALLAYAGSNDVFVATWYDQSGNSNDATQGTSTARPKIYDGATTSVVTENGKPEMQFAPDNNNLPEKKLITGNFTSAITQPATFFSVQRKGPAGATTKGANVFEGLAGGAPNRMTLFLPATSPSYLGLYAGNLITSTTVMAQGQNTVTSLFNGSNSAIYLNSVNTSITGSVGTDSLPALCIGAYNGANDFGNWQGGIQEIILYDSDQTNSPTDNRTGIEANINFFYDIY